jgi:hypothetical protein
MVFFRASPWPEVAKSVFSFVKQGLFYSLKMNSRRHIAKPMQAVVFIC